MDVSTSNLPGAKILTVHPEQMRSLASMPPRYTVHPEHKKGSRSCLFKTLNSLKLKNVQ
jgi:hypothetical protein